MSRRLPLPVLVAGLAITGGALGAGAAALARPGPAVPTRPLPVVAVVRPDALERPQGAVDLAHVPTTAGLLRSSVRHLVALPGSTVLLAGRRAGGEVCLLALSSDRGTWRAACVPSSTFRAEGVGVSWSATTAPLHRSARWDADGAVRAGPSPAQ